jgi:dihydroorotate dehydrogenase
MGIAWKLLAQPSLRLIDSERAHSATMAILSTFGESSLGQRVINSLYGAPELPIEVFGKLFHHPLGLAAGFDKKAKALLSWGSLGFSWTEYGGITRYPQEGNPKPRMFRANKNHALVNSMGFNNPGATKVREELKIRKSNGRWPKSPVAANIGRSKKVSNQFAADDYCSTLDSLYDYADFFVLNISSPNTEKLRDLQEIESLSNILNKCVNLRNNKEINKPLLVKISPDSNDDQILDTVAEIKKHKLDGIVATNTTITRPVPLSTQSRKAFSNTGGLSGRPLHNRSIEVIDLIYQETDGNLPIVGVGGIESKETAWNAITSGASLIQLYSALVFNGPSVASSIVKGLKKNTKENNFSSISEAIGYKHI